MPSVESGNKSVEFSIVSLLLEPITKATVVVSAVLYCVGMLIANEYLMRLGISDFGALRPKYILTGTWAVLLALLLTLPGHPISYLGRTGGLKVQHKRRLGIVLAIILFAIAPPVLWLVLFGLTSQFSFPGGHWYLSYFLSLVCSLAVIGCGQLIRLIQYLLKHGMRRVQLVYALITSVIPIILFLSTQLVARTVYNKIPEALGGGQPVRAHLVLNSDGVIFWNRATTRQIPVEQGGNTGCVMILHTSQDELVIGLPEKPSTVIFLKKSLVLGTYSSLDRGSD
jgi:hypothetical protein